MTTTFPPYDLLDTWTTRSEEKTRKLERLYHQTQAHAWDPRAVLDELVAKHGGVHMPEDKKEAVGHLFAILLWGELAAWNIAADLAHKLEDPQAKMAATGQAFDEARHFYVLRDYLARAGIELPPLNPFGRRVLVRILETDSVLEKLYGMQLLVENLALAIFRRLAETNVEPVLTELLAYVERDESRHVALGVMYLPKLLAKTSRAERLHNWAFNMELFALTIAGGVLLDRHFVAMGLDHRELSKASWRLHQRVLRDMVAEQGLPPGSRIEGIYALSGDQQVWLIDFLHPEAPRDALPDRHRRALDLVDRGVHRLARVLGVADRLRGQPVSVPS